MHKFLVGQKEVSRLHYKTAIVNQDQFVSGLKESFKKDMALQRSTFGIHRDDFEFEFEFGELRKLGSQGQQKSFLVAIKLAHYDVINRHKRFNPILLLDDIFDKLDDHRIEKLLEQVTGKNFGQLFITDAGPERTLELMTKLGIDFDTFHVDNGTIFQK
jgi:DNA replication and repair protein RecF